MTDDDIRGEATPPEQESTSKRDAYAEMLRELPRMRSIEPVDDKGKVYHPPPPTLSRIGSFVHGCGSIGLTLASIPMILVAMWFGYYVWGPGLFLVGGLLLTFGTLGIWRGTRTAIVIAVVIIPLLAIVAFNWSSFLPAAGALSPLGSLALMYDPLVRLIGFALFAAFILHLFTLLYWKRLRPLAPRRIVITTAIGIVLVGLVIGFNVMEQDRRDAWVNDQLAEWTGEAQTDHLELGGSLNVTLGYAFLTINEDDDPRFDVRMAELDAHLAAGAQIMRIGASGDVWLEQEKHRLFADDNEEDLQTAADHIAAQQSYEKEFVTHLTESGVDLYLSDAQYSPYLIVWSNDEDSEDITWETFTKLHTDRIQRYARELQPAYYEIVNEPNSYGQYSGIKEPEDDAERLDAWVQHTEDLIAVVGEESPDTLIGVNVALQGDFELDYYERILELDGLDFVAFRIFQPAAFGVLEDVLEERGHPNDFDKNLWLAETWYGYCLAPQRSMKLDSDWLKAAVAFAAKENMAGAMTSDFGCFLQAGGTLATNDVNLDGRTDVWTAWQSLIQIWSRQ
jgi:hypothetical protein